ncbi:MAG: radical SAM protein, partial [Nanoarchaeota archaeon]
MLKNKASGKPYSILMIIPKQKATREKDYTYIFPLGITYISAVLKKEGYNVDCLNMNHKIGTPEEIINEQLNKKNYDFVGTGSITTAYQVMKKIIDTLKIHRSRPKVILGGLIITSEPETIFKLLEPDYAVIGEGEETVIELLEAIKQKRDLKKIKGIEFRDDKGELILTETKQPTNNLDTGPYPDYEGFEFDKFLNNLHPNSHDYIYSAFDRPRVYSIMGSRGCPFNCTFCYHYNRYRKRSVDSIMQELEIMVPKYKTNIILFYDECIAADKVRLTELCKKMTELRQKISWEIKWYPQLTVHNIDDETLKMMKDAGVAGVSYGFESFSPTVLKSMNKPITPQMIDSAFKKTMKAGLTMQANFIFGDTAETMETAMETLSWWKKNAQGQIHLLFIQPY